MRKLASVVTSLFLAVASFAQSFDISDEIETLPSAAATVLQDHAGALILVLGFFVGLALVLKLLRRFGARSRV